MGRQERGRGGFGDTGGGAPGSVRRWPAPGVLAVVVMIALAGGCARPSAGSAELEGARADAQPTGQVAAPPTAADGGERSPAGTEDPPVDAADTPEPAPVPRFSDDDPLFAELPPMHVDPDTVPEEYEPMLRELVPAGFRAAARMSAAGQFDAELLAATHDGRAYEQLAAGVAQRAEQGLVERTPDLRFTDLVLDYRNANLVWIHACLHPGPRTGLYDIETREMVSQVDQRPLAVDFLVGRRSLPPEEDPQFRILDIMPVFNNTCG